MPVNAAPQHQPFKTTRVQRNVVARGERAVLDWLCERLPPGLTPDGLTLIGVCGALLVLASYVGSRWHPEFLWLASFGFVVHWFGDSLDGSLARHRRIERPIYGYFLDHTVDAICNLMIMVGLGATRYVRMDVALFALIGYYLLCIYVFINNHLSGVFRLSFLGFGPTELRVGLIVLNVVMYALGPEGFVLAGEKATPYDVFIFSVGVIFTIVFLIQVLAGIRMLRDPARSGAVAKTAVLAKSPRPTQSSSRNVSRAAK